MKKIIAVLMIIFMVAFCLLACEAAENTPKTATDKDIWIWTDTETGVQYVVVYKSSGYGIGVGITARLNADGTPYIVTE